MYREYFHPLEKPSRTSPPHASTGVDALKHKDRQDLHERLLPSYDPTQVLPAREKSLRKELDENARRQLRHDIETLEEKAYADETKWRQDSSSIPWMIKGKSIRQKLEPLEKKEQELWERLAKMCDGMNHVEKLEQKAWIKRTSWMREELADLRDRRDEEMGLRKKADGYEPGKEDSGWSSEVQSEGEGTHSVHRAQGRARAPLIRESSVDKGIPHPRRGVGTSSEESEEYSE